MEYSREDVLLRVAFIVRRNRGNNRLGFDSDIEYMTDADSLDICDIVEDINKEFSVSIKMSEVNSMYKISIRALSDIVIKQLENKNNFRNS